MAELKVPQGCGVGILEGGGTYARIHYSVDPSKRSPEYRAEGIKERGAKWWMQQMEMQDDIYEGEPVFPDLIPRHHVPELYRSEYIKLLPSANYVGGWDCGTTRQPAFTLAQLPDFGQIQWAFEVVPQKPMDMGTFAPIVRQELINFMPGQMGRIVHVGDPTGNTKSGTDSRTSFEIAHGYGFNINPGEQFPALREDAVNWALRDWLNQQGEEEQWIPRVIYSEFGAPVLTAGMKGAYCYQLAPQGATVGAGMIVKKALKNWFSHTNDAHQYGSILARQILTAVVKKRRDLTGW